MFDLRHLEHSTIIYEDPTRTPLLRLAWNKQDQNYLATMAMDSTEVGIPIEILHIPGKPTDKLFPSIRDNCNISTIVDQLRVDLYCNA